MKVRGLGLKLSCSSGSRKAKKVKGERWGETLRPQVNFYHIII